jgi:hypothetical protein
MEAYSTPATHQSRPSTMNNFNDRKFYFIFYFADASPIGDRVVTPPRHVMSHSLTCLLPSVDPIPTYLSRGRIPCCETISQDPAASQIMMKPGLRWLW